MNPDLSVVLASQNAFSSVAACLESLAGQVAAGSTGAAVIEVIVVDNSSDGTAQRVAGMCRKMGPNFRCVPVDLSLLIPQLWQIGIENSGGEIVALSTTHFIPARDWISQILQTHDRSQAAGIGGAIENAPGAGLVQWAVYFCRYTPYMPPFLETRVEDIAADNASYKRHALELCCDERRDGFWEPAVHRRLLEEGLHLLQSPDIVVHHQKSFSLHGFIAQRFQHGKQFGTERAARFSMPRRMLYLLLSPVIPFLFAFRIARRVARKKRHRKIFVLASPILMLFLLSWSVGEALGYLCGPRR